MYKQYGAEGVMWFFTCSVQVILNLRNNNIMFDYPAGVAWGGGAYGWNSSRWRDWGWKSWQYRPNGWVSVWFTYSGRFREGSQRSYRYVLGISLFLSLIIHLLVHALFCHLFTRILNLKYSTGSIFHTPSVPSCLSPIDSRAVQSDQQIVYFQDKYCKTSFTNRKISVLVQKVFIDI